MEKELISFVQQNSPDGGFLQSPEWGRFQESVGRKNYVIHSEGFWASIIEHKLPIVGKYFYVPRGPIVEIPNDQISKQIQKLVNFAKKNNAGWIRIEPNDSRLLEVIRENWRVAKAPHDMQPRELFIIDITKPEEELLAEMKSKTRYNIRLAEKKGVRINLPAGEAGKQEASGEYIEDFLRLVKITAERDKITPHPGSYYRKMIETIPGDILKLYVAEYEGKIIAANLVVFYGDTCTYLHGASDNKNRNVMATYLLQWRQILDAKKAGREKYDFGGINTKTGEGITRFKLGFSPTTESTKFPGCFDVIINLKKYWLYRAIQKAKSLIR